LPNADPHTAHKSSTQKREHQITKESSHILHSLFELEREAPGTCPYSCIHCSFTVCNHFVCLSFTNCIKELSSLCCTHASAKQCTKTLSVSPPLSNTTSFLSNGRDSRSCIRNLPSRKKKQNSIGLVCPSACNLIKAKYLCTKLNRPFVFDRHNVSYDKLQDLVTHF